MLSPFLALPRLPPRPDVYARQHSLTRQAVCVCVRCVARPCVCVCVGRKRRCSQALSTCSRSYRAAFRLRALVPAPRACAPSTLLRRSHHPTDLMPTLSRSASAPLARHSVLVSPSFCPPPPSPPPVCARRAHTTLVVSALSSALASPRVLSNVTLLVPRTPPSVEGTASHGIRAHDLPLTKRAICQLS